MASNSRKEILFNGDYYDVTDWIHRHPGGKVIQFYTESGEDATIAIQQFHHRSANKVNLMIKGLRKRPASSPPSADVDRAERHESLTRDFQKLHAELEAEGYFDPSIPHVLYRIAELVVLAALGVHLVNGENGVVVFVGLLLFSMFQGRCLWLMHEGGHHSLTGIPRVDRFLQAVICGVGLGMSSSWWSNQHSRHHAMPQRMHHDVDLDTMPLLAFNAKVVRSGKEGKGVFVQNQAVLFLLVDTFLVMWLWKAYLHPRYAIRKRRYLELALMLIHPVFVHAVGVWPYVFSHWLASVYLFGNFSLSHTHLPVAEGPMHWIEYGLYHTADIEPSWWCDWWMGYLNYQIEHHLFPTMPQFRHPLIRHRVQALARKYHIPYQSIPYTTAVAKTIANLHHVSKSLASQSEH